MKNAFYVAINVQFDNLKLGFGNKWKRIIFIFKKKEKKTLLMVDIYYYTWEACISEVQQI